MWELGKVRVWDGSTVSTADTENYLEVLESLLRMWGLALVHCGSKNTDRRGYRKILLLLFFVYVCFILLICCCYCFYFLSFIFILHMHILYIIFYFNFLLHCVLYSSCCFVAFFPFFCPFFKKFSVFLYLLYVLFAFTIFLNLFIYFN